MSSASVTIPRMSSRVDAMYEKYRAGASLREVGAEHGLSGERVRQLFVAADLKSRSPEEARDRRQAEAAKARREAPKKWHRAGVSAEWVKKKYTAEELVACLREASGALGGILTTHAYNRFAKAREFPDGRPWPTNQTYGHRFGSWRSALQAAGLKANPSSAIAGQRLFEIGHCIDAVCHVHRELGRVPSVTAYEDVAKAENGALPSSATVRNRCGSWSEALRMAGL